MKQIHVLIPLTGWVIAFDGAAGSFEWTSTWAQGVDEYLVDDGNGNSLNISCSTEDDRYISAFATISGKQYSSEDDIGFDVIIDGIIYSNPFFTNCHACGDAFPSFWRALRSAQKLKITNGKYVVDLPTRNINEVITELDSSKNTCKSAW